MTERDGTDNAAEAIIERLGDALERWGETIDPWIWRERVDVNLGDLAARDRAKAISILEGGVFDWENDRSDSAYSPDEDDSSYLGELADMVDRMGLRDALEEHDLDVEDVLARIRQEWCLPCFTYNDYCYDGSVNYVAKIAEVSFRPDFGLPELLHRLHISASHWMEAAEGVLRTISDAQDVARAFLDWPAMCNVTTLDELREAYRSEVLRCMDEFTRATGHGFAFSTGPLVDCEALAQRLGQARHSWGAEHVRFEYVSATARIIAGDKFIDSVSRALGGLLEKGERAHARIEFERATLELDGEPFETLQGPITLGLDELDIESIDRYDDQETSARVAGVVGARHELWNLVSEGERAAQIDQSARDALLRGLDGFSLDTLLEAATVWGLPSEETRRFELAAALAHSRDEWLARHDAQALSTVLVEAVEANTPELVERVRWLLGRGANPDQVSPSGLTAAHIAVIRGDTMLLRVLADEGARLDFARSVESVGGRPEGGHTRGSAEALVPVTAWEMALDTGSQADRTACLAVLNSSGAAAILSAEDRGIEASPERAAAFLAAACMKGTWFDETALESTLHAIQARSEPRAYASMLDHLLHAIAARRMPWAVSACAAHGANPRADAPALLADGRDALEKARDSAAAAPNSPAAQQVHEILLAASARHALRAALWRARTPGVNAPE